MEEFHPSHLDRETPFRESVRHGISTEHLDCAQEIFADALQKHGDDAVTHRNFDKIMKIVKKDHRWPGLHSSGPKLVDAVKDRLKIPQAANDDVWQKAA